MAVKKPTIKDVAKAAGVSTATVGRYIGKYGYVSESKQALLKETIESLGYIPNGIAQGLRTANYRTIGIVLGSIQNPFFSVMLNSIEEAANKLGYTTIVCNSQESVAREKKLLRMLYEKRVNGIILSSAHRYQERVSDEDVGLYENDIPIVLVDRRLDGIKAPVVSIDNRLGGYIGMRYLLEMGHTAVGIIAPQEFSTVEARISGCKEALDEFGIPFCGKRLFRYYNQQESMEKWLARNQDLHAFFTLNSESLADLIKNLYSRIIRKNDITIMNWDDCSLAQIFKCPVIEQPVKEMGEIAVAKLCNIIENGKNNVNMQSRSLMAHLLERGNNDSV